MNQSEAEARFQTVWTWLGGPELEQEYHFHPKRKWRADFAHLPTKTLIEIEGGTWTKGRHTRPIGFKRDCIKYNAATRLGYRVFRLTPDMIDPENLEPIIEIVKTD